MVLLARDVFAVAEEIVVRHGRRDHGEFLQQQPILLAQRVGVGVAASSVSKPTMMSTQSIGGAEWHLDLRDDAVGAVGVADLLQVVAGEFQHARAGLHGRDAQADDVAEVAQPAPADRADAARATGDEAADRGGVVGGGVQPQFLRAVRPGDLVDPRQHRAGIGHDAAHGSTSRTVLKPERSSTIAAGQRHGLSVIAGAGAARRHGDAEFEGGGQRLHDLGLGDREDDDIARNVVELALEDRANTRRNRGFSA